MVVDVDVDVNVVIVVVVVVVVVVFVLLLCSTTGSSRLYAFITMEPGVFRRLCLLLLPTTVA